MRSLAAILVTALVGCSTQSETTRALNALAFPDRLAGWWDEGPATEMRQLCQPGSNLHRHIFAADGATVTWEFQRPMIRDSSRKEAFSYTYRILAVSSRTLTLQLTDETRKTNYGELVKWELVILDDGLFRWRATHFPAGSYSGVWGRRCRSAD